MTEKEPVFNQTLIDHLDVTDYFPWAAECSGIYWPECGAYYKTACGRIVFICDFKHAAKAVESGWTRIAGYWDNRD